MGVVDVCVIGLGYIGLPTACLIAKAGHRVWGADKNAGVIEGLKAGRLHIVNEKGLAELVGEAVVSGRLRFSTSPAGADVFVIAAPTPLVRLERPSEETGLAGLGDFSYVAAAAESIIPFLAAGNLVVLESTVGPGCTQELLKPLLERSGLRCGVDFHLAHAPERVLPGNILHELVHNDRIVGGVDRQSAEMARDFYASFVEGAIVVTDARTAETVKLMENTFRDVNIALANEFALICEKLGVDVWEAISIANRHPRVRILNPGPGVGGHCLAIDPYFLAEKAPSLSPLIRQARKVNEGMPVHTADLFFGLTRGRDVRKVAVLGASYKADVGDERESPALQVAELLGKGGAPVVVHDPFVEDYAGPLDDVLRDADCIVLLTDHTVYRELVPDDVARLVRAKLILDTRDVFGGEWEKAGFVVARLGGPQRG